MTLQKRFLYQLLYNITYGGMSWDSSSIVSHCLSSKNHVKTSMASLPIPNILIKPLVNKAVSLVQAHGWYFNDFVDTHTVIVCWQDWHPLSLKFYVDPHDVTPAEGVATFLWVLSLISTHYETAGLELSQQLCTVGRWRRTLITAGQASIQTRGQRGTRAPALFALAHSK